MHADASFTRHCARIWRRFFHLNHSVKLGACDVHCNQGRMLGVPGGQAPSSSTPNDLSFKIKPIAEKKTCRKKNISWQIHADLRERDSSPLAKCDLWHCISNPCLLNMNKTPGSAATFYAGFFRTWAFCRMASASSESWVTFICINNEHKGILPVTMRSLLSLSRGDSLIEFIFLPEYFSWLPQFLLHLRCVICAGDEAKRQVSPQTSLHWVSDRASHFNVKFLCHISGSWCHLSIQNCREETSAVHQCLQL